MHGRTSGISSFTRRRLDTSQGPGRESAGRGASRHRSHERLPLGFDAVGDALAAGRCPLAACGVVGRALAGDGASLGEALAGLRETYEVLRGSAPDFPAAEALSVAWSDATLDFVQDVACEDPLTGLASAPHLRSRLAEVYREGERRGADVRRTHALVVVHTGGASRRAQQAARGQDAVLSDLGGGPLDLRLVRALRLATVGEGVRTAFPGEETIARLGPDSVVALARRTPELGEQVARTRAVLLDLGLPPDLRVWIEGLPGRLEHAARLLGDLAAP